MINHVFIQCYCSHYFSRFGIINSTVHSSPIRLPNHTAVWVLILVSDELFDTRVSTRIFLVNGKYPYTNVRILRPGFVTQGFDSRCVVSSIKSRKSRRGSRARADATHRRSAAILAPLHISRDRNTGESTFSCSRVPVASLASRPARASPATFRVGELGALRRRASVLLKCHRETGRDRGVRVADPTFTSRES